MAGLSDLSKSTTTTSTTLPSWYTDAQQKVVSGALGTAAPQVQDTAAQAAVNMFSNAATNPYMQGQNVLGQIAQGAVNPFTTTYDAAGTPTTTPNVSTPMGGLYAAQQQYLNQLLPNIEATATAPMTATGGFGSRMNISAADIARGQAANELFKNQMQSALAAQQVGAQAGAGLGTLGQQQVEGALATGKYQTGAPFINTQQWANILGSIKPEQVQKQENIGDLYNQLAALGVATTGGLGALGTVFPGLVSEFPNLFKLTDIVQPTTAG